MTWLMLRAAGIGAYAMLFLSVAWGLAATTSVLGRRVSRATATTTHQFLATCGLFLVAIHLGGLLVDRFEPFSIVDLTVPLAASYRPVAVAFGILAMYAVVLVTVTSWLRKPIGTRWWRRIHLLTVPAFALSMIHGIFSGTDTGRPLMWWTYVGTALVVVILLMVRGLTAGIRPERTPHPQRTQAAA